MIWRSVVGKLWLTIIALVATVLIVLSVFISDQMVDTYGARQEENLLQLAHHMQQTLEGMEWSDTATKADDGLQVEQYIKNVFSVTSQFDTHVLLFGEESKKTPIATSSNVPADAWTSIVKKIQLEKVYKGEELTLQGEFVPQAEEERSNFHFNQFSLFSEENLLVAVPIREDGEVTGAVVLYQPIDEPQVHQLIFYSALIGIILTTFFAFFLTSRITKPLILMKKAAEEMAQSHFSRRIPVRIYEWDEIGELAITFNRMAGKLYESVTALSQEKEQLSSILRSMVDGVITMDANGRVIVTNPPAEKLLMQWRDQEAGDVHIDLLEEDLPSPLKDIFQTVVEDEKDHSGEITVHGRTWSVVMAPLYAREQVRGGVAVLRDVTEAKRLDKLRKDFVANVSHELRTPLAMLQGYSEALLDDVAQSPEERKELTKVIHDESLRMGRLVHELLDLARMESGHIRLHRDRMGVKEWLERVERKFHGVAVEQQIELEVKTSTSLPFVYWDEDKMEQVLTNLIDNAIRHTSEEGTVHVRAEAVKEMIHLTVRDTGSGIPEEDLPFIFERFYKADKARKRGQGGTGLGLAIVKHIVEAHGGSVTVESEQQVGTMFTIRIPIGDGEDGIQFA
ncbi:cell wall metabolism sensor histidine kinase WalK [Mechercharimyces sp. CAU 1602]|uniref:cell wall metabolism sensor histidine kinase WalK n=1 Tax=Mechercharimyces sp. CAU 1602 TaxID=2973933 RepID=UPI0021619245|nr:cell wall metabolism sensor histidine kinase WalK [Mechercharimyces sp. CAU 1602]MCS1350932.1 cell wall metabolism sensor histidine kinase WalK [Mechercharimyces sp. CAU 1602]